MGLQKKVKWLFGLIVAANFVLVLIVVLGALEPPPRKPLPNPNGYDDFVKAGNLVNWNVGDYSTMKVEELAALAVTNAEALRLLRVGLGKACQTPNDYSLKYFDKVLPDYANQKKLAMNLAAEGRLAILQGRTNDAVQSYLDTARFGVQCCRGGIAVAKLVGVACEAIGRRGLYSLMDGVNSGQCLKIVRELEVMDEQESPLSDMMEREHEFVRKNYTLRQRMVALLNYKQQRQSKARIVAKVQTNQLQRRQMMLDFATRAYRLEKNKSPASITDLVPDYLKSIPKDPVTGSNLVLRAGAPQ